ncbi:IclR family transcriptional regulator [Stutzerimonas kirkiae]|uniref:IclR family transcriptional regulator n=1 Tax=Stutzerimonas kirkiae TaxID=2211392 RepID=A0A4Q9RC27_9GAMM|nr:IclR family transcriptional regulator [Stutzerimonas kirkiae]TBU97819.1 IclR family transcriptional regulator [Stutzerimonas kirkiae]TBV04830.1 IclR family transcriptional regulator [Stutzerimonas kirkiae]TBV11966.1 IclR family transcriptional regulator [Stutzerimonas kirkiae]TBV15025.1 IclR family transcriptional regulator [Stutzerimonas kirkiae]
MTLHDEPTERDTDYRVPALQRGLSIVQMFSAAERSLSANEIAERLGVSLSAIYRIVFTLTEMGYLRKLGKNSYELGPQVLCDGFAYLASRDLADIAMAHLNALRDRTSLSCHLSIREQTDSLYIYRAFAAQRLSVNIPIGTRIPCHCTAMGRMLLSGLSPMELDRLYQHVRLDDYPPPAPKTLPELHQLLERDRERGWVLHRSDYSTAIASAIHDHRGDVVAAINLSGPEAVMDSPVARERYRESLQQCAQAISRELGARQPA